MNQISPLFLMALLTTACVDPSDKIFRGTSTGNALEIGLSSGDSSTVDADLESSGASGTVFSVLSANSDVSKIAFDLPSLLDCDSLGLESPMACESSGNAVVIAGDYEADLIAAEFDPPLTELTLPAMAFEEIGVEMNAMNFGGEFTYLEETIAFNVELIFDEAISFTAEPGISLEDDQTLQMMMNVSDWLNDSPIVSCIESGDLQITASSLAITNACDNAIDKIADAVLASTYLDAE